MRVLLVYSNASRDLVPAPPVGLGYVATATAASGHEVRVLDLVTSARPADELRGAVRAFAPDVVGVSVRNIDNVVLQRIVWHLGDVPALLAAVRAERASAALVLGGPAISILGPGVLERLDADFAVVGEGEAAFPALLSAIARNEPAHTIPGVCARTADGIRSTPASRLARFDRSGMEQWVEWRSYERLGGTWPIQTKRGCPLRCIYCAYPAIEGAATRARSAGEVVDEIERVLAHAGPRTFEFVDSTFNVPPDHAEAICLEIVRRGLDVNLSAMGVNPLGVSERLFSLMRRAGFNSMMVTAESASDAILRTLRKGFTVERVRETARLAEASGIASAWFFMLGGPGETRETVEETVAFIERHLTWRRCVTIVMTGVRVLPGTPLAALAAREGRVQPGDDLAAPTFYVSAHVPEAIILERLAQALQRCPTIVHAAEEGTSSYERLVDRALHLLGVAPPYWRFLPQILRVPPVPLLRRRQRSPAARSSPTP